MDVEETYLVRQSKYRKTNFNNSIQGFRLGKNLHPCTKCTNTNSPNKIMNKLYW